MTNEDILADILNLCEFDPDAGLEFIESIIRERPTAKSDPFEKFAKAIAYGSKGLFQLARSKPDIDFTGFDEKELKDYLGITDVNLDYLEKGLQEIKEMEEIRPEALRLFGEQAELKVDAMALVLERCRPGRVQEILGKTKLAYFGPNRVKVMPSIKSDIEESRVFKKICWKTFFSLPTVARSALILDYGQDSKGRQYVHCMLFEKIFDVLGPNDTLSKCKSILALYLFDDGTFAYTL
jgi:hypothetical protein